MYRLKNFMRRYAIFGFGGLIAFIFELFFTFFLIEYFRFHFAISFAISLIFGGLFLYLYHSRITFVSSSRKKRVHFFLYYFTVGIFFWALSQLIQLFVKVHYLFAIGFAAIPISLINYKINRHLIFCERH